MKPKILIIEDEPAIAENIRFALSTEGFEPQWKPTGREGLAAFRKGGFDLVILDIGLPDQSGLDLCKEIRKSGETPVIFLTARASELDKVLGLEIGADDYMVKPFSPRELTARVKTILRRTRPGATSAPAGQAKHFQVDGDRKVILYRGKELDLTKNEFLVLGVLLNRPGQVFSREQILETAWESPGSSLGRTVDAHIKSIRQKLKAVHKGADPIQTHRGFGYSMKAEP